MGLHIFIAAIILVWLGFGFLARGFYRYMVIRKFAEESENQHHRSFINQEIIQNRILRLKHELIGFILFFCGFAGLSALLVYALMEPDEDGNIRMGLFF